MSRAVTLADVQERWEAARRRGQHVPPEDLCSGCPHLLEPLRRWITSRAETHGTITPESDTSARSSPDAVASSTPAPLHAGGEPVPGYRLVRLLGRGGFGEVWQAEAPGGFPVAVKFVTLAGRVGAAELRSLPILRRIRHPNVLSTFGSWQIDGRLVIVMELADGTLADRLARAKYAGQSGVPADELLGYMRGAAKGLDYLNEPRAGEGGEPPQSIRHQDVKPQNLLLLADHVKVGDFGLARVLEATLGKHSGGFTPAYSAPEFFAGESARQSDQYSLAVAYCELRGGRLPFTGSIGEMVLGHMERPPDLSMIPPAERPAVARALAKKPADRWPTCGVFVEAVEAAVATATASEPVALTTSYRPARRRSVVPFVAVGLVVAVIAGCALVLVFGQPKTGEPLAGTPTTSESPTSDQIPPATSRPTETETRPTENIPPPTTPLTRPMQPQAPPTVHATPATVLKPKDEQPRERQRFKKHAKAVRGVAWVPNSTRVVSCGDEGDVWVWDTATGESKHLVGHQGAVHAVTGSADGKQALTAGDDMTVRLWDVEKGELVHKLKKEQKGEKDQDFEMYAVAFDGDDRAVSAGNGNLLIRWDLITGKESGRLTSKLPEVFAFIRSPDGKHLLLGGGGGKVIVRGMTDDSEEVGYAGHTDDVLAAAWFPDGKRFVTAGGGMGNGVGQKDYTIRVWTVGKDVSVSLEGHDTRVMGVAVSPDGKRILSGDSGGRLRLWDVPSEKELPRIDADTKDPSAVNAVAFSPDGSEAVSGHKDGTVQVWRLPK